MLNEMIKFIGRGALVIILALTGGTMIYSIYIAYTVYPLGVIYMLLGTLVIVTIGGQISSQKIRKTLMDNSDYVAFKRKKGKTNG